MLEPALHYLPEAYQTNAPKLMGRNAAGEAFMRAWLKHSTQATFRARVDNEQHAVAFRNTVHATRPDANAEAVTPQALHHLSKAGLLYYPGPDLAQSAWQRALIGAERWSLCGVTHTTASAAAMDAITSWLSAPLQPWDAVICTSIAVADTTRRVLEAQAQHLTSRMGATRFTLPMLPVIPLGVHCEDFCISPDERAQARQALGITEDCCVVLYVGRLSFHAKAHPLPMYLALQEALARCAPGTQAMLIECGWHANDAIAKAFEEAAKSAMPDVSHVSVDGRESALRRQAWAAADVFCSLSDNIQETFGLTPIEAMAAGLPCVVSDWNGYKDTVRHGIDGMRVPTCMPPAGDGVDLARSHALGTINYDHYCGHASTSVAIDIQACAEAFAALFAQPALRATMGQAAQARARSVFDWAHVYRQYDALWQELSRRRVAAAAQYQQPAHPWPARMEPHTAFAGYPSATLGEDTLLTLRAASVDEALTQLASRAALAMVRPFAGGPDEQALARHILAACAAAPTRVKSLYELPGGHNPAAVRRRTIWLCKFGLLRASQSDKS